MKKTVTAVLAGVILTAGLGTAALADIKLNTQQMGNVVYDLTPVREKSTNVRPTLPGVVSTQAAPTNTSKTTASSPLFGDSYAVSTSDSTIQEDSISAKCRVYDGDGSLLDSKEDKQTNSSHAGTPKTINGTAYYGNDYALGNHVYQEAGYYDVIHETRDDF